MTRRAVVTGASTGIGAATARLLRTDGWEVVAVARRADRLEALAAETGAVAFPADLTDADAVASLTDFLRGSGPVHALVQIAGGARGADRIEDGDPDQWEWMYQANVLAAQRLVAALLPLLRDGADATGHADIVVLTSVAAASPYPGGGGYNAAKAAEAMIPRVLRLELSGEPIRVSEIAPGMVQTEEFSLRRMGGDEAAADKVYADVDGPLVAEDIADVIRYVLDAPRHVNFDHITVRPIAQSAQHLVHRGPLRVRRPSS